MPRPNSRVEIVTAMRRIRVSVVRMLLPLLHRGSRGTAPPSPLTAFSHISPVLQVIHNSYFSPSLSPLRSPCNPGMVPASFMCHTITFGASPALAMPCGTRASHLPWLGLAAARVVAEPSPCSWCCMLCRSVCCGGEDGVEGGCGMWGCQHRVETVACPQFGGFPRVSVPIQR